MENGQDLQASRQLKQSKNPLIWDDSSSSPTVWPCWMPTPDPSAMGYASISGMTENIQMDIGSLNRRNFDVDASTITCEMVLDDCQIAFFEAFENDLLQQGRIWFRMPLLLGGNIADYKVRFEGRPSYSDINAYYTKVTFSLFVGRKMLPPVILPEYTENKLPEWPDGLPNLLQDGYSYELVDNTLASSSDLPTRKRVDFIYADTAYIKGKVKLNYQQLVIFSHFERETLYNACRYFSLPIWISGERKAYKVKFTAPPDVSLSEGLYGTVSFELELDERDLLSADAVAILLVFSPDELERMRDKLHYGLHVLAPGSTWIPKDVFVTVDSIKEELGYEL